MSGENENRHRPRLLLVDDERAFGAVLSKRLTKRGFDVSLAYSGTQAIQSLRAREFDVAILDLKMEDMDGIEVLKIFLKMDPELPVLMLTGHGSEQAAREGIACGAVDYLTKPYELEDLLEKLTEALQSKKGSTY